MFSSACYFERSNNHSNSLHLIFQIFGFIKSLPIRQTPQLQIGFKFKHSFVLQYDGTLVLWNGIFSCEVNSSIIHNVALSECRSACLTKHCKTPYSSRFEKKRLKYCLTGISLTSLAQIHSPSWDFVYASKFLFISVVEAMRLTP